MSTLVCIVPGRSWSWSLALEAFQKPHKRLTITSQKECNSSSASVSPRRKRSPSSSSTRITPSQSKELAGWARAIFNLPAAQQVDAACRGVPALVSYSERHDEGRGTRFAVCGQRIIPLRLLSNVRVELLPPNTTAKLQPLDQVIIYRVKRGILHRKMKLACRRLDNGKDKVYNVGLLKAVKWCVGEWSKLSAATIRNCWLRSGLLDKSSVSYVW